MSCATDEEIRAFARQENRTCVTLDHDFHSHLALSRSDGPGWGAIGLASFFIPQYSIAFAGMAILRAAGAPRASFFLGVVDLVASAAIAAWVYNKLMERAIQELASLDAKAAASTSHPA